MQRICLVLLFALAFVPLTAIAQTQTGTPPFGTFTGGPDIVNTATLNVHYNIPILLKSGRGMGFRYNLSYDSWIWSPVVSGSKQVWQPVANKTGTWGWQGLLPEGGTYVLYNVTATDQTCGAGNQGSYTEYDFSNFVYYDASGTSHPFNAFGSDVGKVINWVPGCPTDSEPQPSSTTGIAATDGSAYTLFLNPPNLSDITAYLMDADGTTIDVPVVSTPPSSTGSTKVTDRNGNEITSTNGAYVDTLGDTVLTVAGSPPTLSYTAPSGATAKYAVSYKTYTVKTNFQCSGISEFGPTGESLVDKITLPDGSYYQFTYEATPNYSGDVTGRVASVRLPTGGTISYVYAGNNFGIECATGSPSELQRTTPDSSVEWTYVPTLGSGAASTTAVYDPQGNETLYSFQGIYQTERRVYQGSSTLLEDDVTCYNGNTSNCNSTAITLPITERMVTSTLGSQECKHVYFYNGIGLLTEQDDYDYGNGAPGPLIRKKLITYASLGNNIAVAPSQITIQNGSGGTVAQTTYQYDQTGVVAPPSPSPQHVSISGSRGNATTISRLVGSTSLSEAFTYYDTGNVDVATDVNNAQTKYNYPDATSTCGNAFPTSVSEPLGLSSSMTWNCTGGVETSVTDENSNTTSTAYTDPDFWRPGSATDQERNLTSFTYANANSVESSLLFNGSNSTTNILATLDSLGRTSVSQQRERPSSSTYDSVETDYDSLGRLSRTTVPYSGTNGQTNGSSPATTTTYDALYRPLVITDGGLGTVTLSYPANDVLQTIGPAPTGENTKQRQSEYNSIGQLTSVCEVTAGTTAWPGGNCAQNTSATGYWTKYTYDALGDLLTVAENAQSSQTQSRSYTYDGLGRMTSEMNPEIGDGNPGTNYYFYDADPGTKGGANCSGTYSGDLVKKVDNAGNVTCYTYDALHHVTSITYPYGPNSTNSPSKYFVYGPASGNVTVDGVNMGNAKGRLAEAYTCVSSCSSKITDEGFSYTARGEVQTFYESTQHSNGYFWVNQTYWANGVPDVLTDNLGNLPGITYGVDGEGRINSVSAGSGQNPVTSTSYNVASEATQVNLGSGDNDAFSFDSSTFRMTQYQFNINGQSDTGKLTWNANGTLGKLAITDAFNSSDTQTCTYSHDDLARIAGGNCGSIWSQTFSYDAFGNITKMGSEQFQPGYNYQTNQMSSGASYDSNGDVLSDSLHSYAWNSDTRPTTIDSVTVTYDALGRMVEQNNSGSYMQIVWSPTGAKLGYMNGQAFEQADVSLPAGMVAAYNSSGLLNYHHMDWLGSYRLASTPSRSVYWDGAYAPFGEPYAQHGNSVDLSFGSNSQDTVTNLYDAQFREYEIYGRWPSPDPAGVAAVDPTNPQSWNRYAYVLNNPLASVDPLGTNPCTSKDQPGCPNGGGGIASGCIGADPGSSTFTQCGGWLGYAGMSPWAWFNIIDPFDLLGIPIEGQYNWHLTEFLNYDPDPNDYLSQYSQSPQSPGRVSQVARCAANLANTMSVAHYAHLQNVPVASNIFSNDFSSLTNLFFGPGRPGAAVGLAENLGSGPALSLTGKGTGAVTVDSGFQFLFSSVPATTFGETAIGGVLTKSLSVAADWLSGEAEAQAIYDAGIYTGAVYVCAEQ